MTEKRFIRNIIGQVYDTKNDKFFQEDYNGKPIGYEDDLVECLNALHEENQALKHQRQESINEIAVIALKYKALQDVNTHFKNLIQEAYVNERTEMGKSVLKQLADNLGVEIE